MIHSTPQVSLPIAYLPFLSDPVMLCYEITLQTYQENDAITMGEPHTLWNVHFFCFFNNTRKVVIVTIILITDSD